MKSNYMAQAMAFLILSCPAFASIPPEIQQKIEKDIASGDYRTLTQVSITENGVSSRLFESNVDVSEMVKLIARGDSTVLKDPSLSYRPKLANNRGANNCKTMGHPDGPDEIAYCYRLKEQREKYYFDHMVKPRQKPCRKWVYSYAANGFICGEANE